jgi:hypothetical protein
MPCTARKSGHVDLNRKPGGQRDSGVWLSPAGSADGCLHCHLVSHLITRVSTIPQDVLAGCTRWVQPASRRRDRL